MKRRTLGGQGLEVGALGLGTIAYGPSDDDEQSIATVRRAHELVVTMFDTAGLYGMGLARTSGCLVGRWRVSATRWRWPPSSATT